MTDRYAAARKHLRDADPVLARLIDKHPNFDPRAWMAELPRMDAYGALVFQIVGQQLSVRATRAILARLEALFGGRLPEPQEILDADPEELRRAGKYPRKGETLSTHSDRLTIGELIVKNIIQGADEEIEAALTAIPGIGPWTVHGFLIIALDRPDVVLAGDLALRRAIRDVYGLDQMPTEPEVMQLAERWRPYRSLAVSYLFASEFET
jgi:DNA-3-methyladenine glycosylase II